MICPSCRGTGTAGDARYANRDYRGPCLTCNGSGRAHCCEGECEQPMPETPKPPEEAP